MKIWVSNDSLLRTRKIIVVVTIAPTMIAVKVENISFLFQLFSIDINPDPLTPFILTAIKNRMC